MLSVYFFLFVAAAVFVVTVIVLVANKCESFSLDKIYFSFLVFNLNICVISSDFIISWLLLLVG